MKINYKNLIHLFIGSLLIVFQASYLTAQNTLTIKTYQDDITNTPDLVDGSEAVPIASGSTNSIKAVIVDSSTDNVVAIQEITSSPTTISSIPNGTYNVHIVENYTGSIGDSAPSGPSSFNDQTTTGAAAGDNITATYPQYPIATNVEVSNNTTVSFGFTSEAINYGMVSGYVRDDNNIGVGGVDVFLIRTIDNSVAQSFQTVNTVPDINDYGEYKFNNVPPGEYYVSINIPTGFNVVGNDQSSDGDTTPETMADNIIPVTVDQSENDSENNYTLSVPTNADDCTAETTDVRFDWSASTGSGNEWTNAENSDGVMKTYSLSYTDGLGDAQTLDVTMKMLDPAGTNIDNNFVCPFTGCDDQYNRYTSTNGFFGSGFLTVAQATTNTTDEVTFEFTFSKPVYVKNFSVSDIDYVSLTQYGPKVSFQDEVTITAENESNPVSLEYTVGSNLQLVNGNTIRSNEYITTGGGANGDSSPSYPSNTVYVNSMDQATKLIVKYRNGQDEANISGDNGKSDGHFVRINGFNLCAVNYAAIHGQLTEDTTGDNMGNVGNAGATIILKNADGSLATYADGSAIPTIMTSNGSTDVDGDGNIDPAGSYYIPNINAGSYIVEVVTPSGYNDVNDGDASPNDGGSNTPDNNSTTDGAVPVVVDAGQREMNNDFVIRNASLPVTLISFDAIYKRHNVLLSWSTASEQNNDYYIIEYSFNGHSFNELSLVKGNGSINTTSNYEFKHEEVDGLGHKNIYYRLAQVDYDGNTEYIGNVIAIHLSSYKKGLLFPNPVRSGDDFSIIGVTGNQTYVVYNMMGRKILQSSINNNQTVISTNDLDSGVYFIQLSNGDLYRFIVE